MISAKLSCIEVYVPKKLVTNDDLAKVVDTSHEWIFSRTGIKQRYFAEPDQNNSDMVIEACRNLITNNNIDPLSIDGLIVATTTPDFSFPSVAAVAQNELSLKNSFAFDISAACSGFIFAIHNAKALISAGMANKIIIVGSDKMSSILDWEDRSTCVLFGDGAGCALIEKTTVENPKLDPYIIDSQIFTDGSFVDILHTSGGLISGNKVSVKMNGKEVYKQAISKMSAMVEDSLSKNGYSLDDLDYIIPHQANIRIIEKVSEKLSIKDKMIDSSLCQHGNTSAASIPLAFNCGIKDNIIKKGNLILTEAIGAGLTWGYALIRY